MKHEANTNLTHPIVIEMWRRLEAWCEAAERARLADEKQKAAQGR